MEEGAEAIIREHNPTTEMDRPELAGSNQGVDACSRAAEDLPDLGDRVIPKGRGGG